LESEIILQQFDEIEKKVEKLIEALKSLEAINIEFKDRIQHLTDELQGKVEAERKHDEERDLIRSKVDNLLIRLDEIAEA